MLDLPGQASTLDLDFGQKRCDLGGAGGFKRSGHRAVDFPERAGVDLLLLAATDQQHTITKRIFHIMQQQGVTQVTLELTSPDQIGNLAAAGFVESLGGC